MSLIYIHLYLPIYIIFIYINLCLHIYKIALNENSLLLWRHLTLLAVSGRVVRQISPSPPWTHSFYSADPVFVVLLFLACFVLFPFREILRVENSSICWFQVCVAEFPSETRSRPSSPNSPAHLSIHTTTFIVNFYYLSIYFM
eukprot:GHVL01011931.1.p1 GENE.GHVL01011931.1~~GHVL01011931.1.p1  ORF type:complete len:143 (-),score=11.15 GHVL01011931.1:24-452(-)